MAKVKQKGKLAAALAKNVARNKEREILKRKEKTRLEIERSKKNKGVKKQIKTIVMPYTKTDRILLVGEGNFSFTHALIEADYVNPALVVATAYDSEEVASTKYPDLAEHVNAIRGSGGLVLFGVDASKLNTNKQIKEIINQRGGNGFDKVVFNFPHVGQGITDQNRNIRANQTLMLLFFNCVSKLLTEGLSRRVAIKSKKGATSDDEEDEYAIEEESAYRGTVLVTLRTTPPYSYWNVTQLATKANIVAPSIILPAPKTLFPTYSVVRSYEFTPETYPGYEHRRTIGYQEGKSSRANEDIHLTAKERKMKNINGPSEAPKQETQKALIRTYEFELVDDLEDD